MAQYATIQDLRDLGLPPEALTNIDARALMKFLTNAGDLIDTYAIKKNALPLSGSLLPTNTFPGSIVRCNIIIAAYDLIVWRGFQPDAVDDQFQSRYDNCIEWLKELAKGAVSLLPTADATPNTSEGAPRVLNNAAGTINRSPDGNVRQFVGR